MAPGDLRQRPGDLALGQIQAQGLAQGRRPPAKALQEPVEHGAKHFRHPGHHMHIAQRKARRGGNRIVDQHRAFGDAGHALARLVELDPHPFIARRQQGARVFSHRDPRAKGRADRIGGDVVMGRADPAGGEYMAVAPGQRAHRLADRRRVIADHAHFAQVDPRLREPAGEVMGIAVAGAPREDLVADHQHCRGRVCP